MATNLAKGKIKRVCKLCNKNFEDYINHREIFCSQKCYILWERSHPEEFLWIKGLNIGRKRPDLSEYNNIHKKGCKTWLGKHHKEESKQKIREKATGRPVSLATREKLRITSTGKIHSQETIEILKKRRGWHHTKESIEKIKINRKGKCMGPEHYNWNDGSSFEPYGIEFNSELKNYIRWMDDYTCQQCGIPQDLLNYKLCVHHIDFNKKNNQINNLISLCRTCHMQTNFNRQDWTIYFQNKILGGNN